MERRRLGDSDLDISTIGFGCWTIGGRNFVDGLANGWADPDPDEVVAGIKVALDAGVNHFDNADVYGNGTAERRLRDALRKLGASTDDLVLATKVGHHRGTAAHAYEPQHIRAQCEQSLINLGRDHIDLYYFHHGDFGANDQHLSDAIGAMRELQAAGKIRAIGLSAYHATDFVRLVPRIKPAAIQTWAHALDDQFIRNGSVLADLLDRTGIGFVAFSPLAQGRLLGKFTSANPPSFPEGDHRRGQAAFSAEALATLEPRIERLKARFGDDTESLVAMALGYVLAHPVVTGVIPGFRNARQAQGNVAGQGKALSLEDVAWMQGVLGE
jgi:aryl-alcohol dehydrogenase-like predicted oxidoreductase